MYLYFDFWPTFWFTYMSLCWSLEYSSIRFCLCIRWYADMFLLYAYIQKQWKFTWNFDVILTKFLSEPSLFPIPSVRLWRLEQKATENMQSFFPKRKSTGKNSSSCTWVYSVHSSFILLDHQILSISSICFINPNQMLGYSDSRFWEERIINNHKV